jgi:hypothetical protein
MSKHESSKSSIEINKIETAEKRLPVKLVAGLALAAALVGCGDSEAKSGISSESAPTSTGEVTNNQPVETNETEPTTVSLIDGLYESTNYGTPGNIDFVQSDPWQNKIKEIQAANDQEDYELARYLSRELTGHIPRTFTDENGNDTVFFSDKDGETARDKYINHVREEYLAVDSLIDANDRRNLSEVESQNREHIEKVIKLISDELFNSDTTVPDNWIKAGFNVQTEDLYTALTGKDLATLYSSYGSDAETENFFKLIEAFQAGNEASNTQTGQSHTDKLVLKDYLAFGQGVPSATVEIGSLNEDTLVARMFNLEYVERNGKTYIQLGSVGEEMNLIKTYDEELEEYKGYGL